MSTTIQIRRGTMERRRGPSSGMRSAATSTARANARPDAGGVLAAGWCSLLLSLLGLVWWPAGLFGMVAFCMGIAALLRGAVAGGIVLLCALLLGPALAAAAVFAFGCLMVL